MKLVITESGKEFILPNWNHETIIAFQNDTGEVVDKILPLSTASQEAQKWENRGSHSEIESSS